jgi:hypothetical protein
MLRKRKKIQAGGLRENYEGYFSESFLIKITRNTRLKELIVILSDMVIDQHSLHFGFKIIYQTNFLSVFF